VISASHGGTENNQPEDDRITTGAAGMPGHHSEKN